MIKRAFDIICSLIGLLILLPLFLILALIIVLDGGPAFYSQIRVGKNQVPFKLLKFRSMRINADKLGKITVGAKDPRITHVGFYLRKYKLDELPQLLNVLKGDMSLVGPRPEVPEYVAYYTKEQLNVLNVKPGITDYASLMFYNENELLAKAENPLEYYKNEVMPQKLAINLSYVNSHSLWVDFKIIIQTLAKIVR